MSDNGRIYIPGQFAGFRQRQHWDTIQKLAAQMAKMESDWIEANLRAELPAFILWTMDKLRWRWPCKLYTKWHRIEFKRVTTNVGSTIDITRKGKIVKRGRSRIEGDAWKITQVPIEEEQTNGR